MFPIMFIFSEPVSGITFFMKPIQDNSPTEPESSFFVKEEIILDAADPRRSWYFGCIVSNNFPM